MEVSPGRWATALLSCGLLAFAGCGDASGPQRYPLHGTVRVEGVLVSKGAITLLPASGNSGPAASTFIRDGEYAFDGQTGPGDGPHRVVIAADALDAAGTLDAGDTAGSEAPAADAPIDAAEMKRSTAGTSSRRQASKTDTAGRSLGQWDTTYTVPPQGDYRKDFDLTTDP